MPKSAVKSKPAPRKTAKLAPRPENWAWISAYLSVKSPETAIPWYEKAFGFKKSFAMPGENGKIMHAELTYKDNTIMLGPENPHHHSTAPATLKGSPVTIYVYCENVDKIAEQSKKAGATILQEPTDMFWGDRITSLSDPEGHKWTFAQHVKEWDQSQGCGESCH